MSNNLRAAYLRSPLIVIIKQKTLNCDINAREKLIIICRNYLFYSFRRYFWVILLQDGTTALETLQRTRTWKIKFSIRGNYIKL